MTAVGRLFHQAAERWPDREFVIFQGERRTFGGFAAWVNAIGTDLLERGVRPGQRLMIHVPNCLEALDRKSVV